MKNSLMPIQFIRLQLLLYLVINLTGSFGYSQSLKFQPYGADKGLPDNYVYNIQQDDNGYLWLGTGEGLCRFDGFNFSVTFPGDSLSNGIVDKSYKDTRGRLWFGFRDGSIAVYQNSSFKVIHPNSDFLGIIAGIEENSQGQIMVVTQDKGIIFIREDYSLTYLIRGLEGQNLSSVCLTKEGEILVGTFNGLFLYQFSIDNTALELKKRIEDIPHVKILSIDPKQNTDKYWIGTEDEGLYQLDLDKSDTTTGKSTKIGTQCGLQYSKVQKVFEDNEANLWVCTNGEGVFRLIPAEKDSSYTDFLRYTDQNGLPSNYISDIFRDNEGNLWFSTIGQGLTALKDQSFSFYNFENSRFNDNVLSLANEGSIYYLGGENGIMVTDISHKQPDVFLDNSNGIPSDRITVLFKDSKSYIWIGTSRSGIYRLKIGEKSAQPVFSSQNSLENSINAIKESQDFIWVATNGGVLRFGKNDFSKTRLTTSERLPHNEIKDILVDSKDNTWIATRANGLFNISKFSEYSINARTEIEFVAITEDKDGFLWAATDGDGVFLFSSDTLRHFYTEKGLRSNYCYSISCDSKGNIWVGHRRGMSKIERNTRLIKSYSVEQGISVDCNPNAIITNSKKNLVFGTSKGIIEYDPVKDKKDTVPPKLNITSIRISDQDYSNKQDIILPYNIYKLRVDFIGINLKNPEGIKYQYKLIGYDDSWSEPSSLTTANFRLEDGKYTFVLRACDEMGNCAESSLLNLTIKIPFWKTWWFILVSIFTLVATVYIIIKVRERNQKQIQEYLQRSLDERTKEVREQAEEIENKNRDITDSINYAQRIQASILPPIKRLQDTFAGSFVFYQPRDIVSGDFYWYDRIWDNKFVIVCADSTGHGVPGAFMSMIGATLIKDICSRPGVRSPALMLKTLDQEIMNALNQNIEAEKSTDGMDIIVAEIDLHTKYMRVASAMRPLILYINDEQVYVKGSRNSVGGRFDIEYENKVFEEDGYQLSSGDLIYMFSDGYPDQFGGPLGKKFKMVRLKNLLRDIHDKSMEEQYNYVKNNFILWKEDLEQVDDVLFMGIKI